MNNKLKKTLLTAGLATAVMVTSAAQADGNGNGDGTDGNPLMKKSVLPFGAPDFRIIKETDYLPALKAGIGQQREEIRKIVENKEKPTFKNTILAYEESGQLLGRVSSIFFGLTNANKTPTLGKAAHGTGERNIVQPEILRAREVCL